MKGWQIVADLGRRMKLCLVHGWERIKNVQFYSLLALSTHTDVKCYPTMTKMCLNERMKTGCGKIDA